MKEHSRKYSNIRRVNYINRNKISHRTNNLCILSLLVIVMFFSVFGLTYSAKAKSNDEIYTYYTSVEIKKGDTLWSIANDHMSGTGYSNSEYIKELVRLNNLKSTSITQGQYLTVFYCSSEYK